MTDKGTLTRPHAIVTEYTIPLPDLLYSSPSFCFHDRTHAARWRTHTACGAGGTFHLQSGGAGGGAPPQESPEGAQVSAPETPLSELKEDDKNQVVFYHSALYALRQIHQQLRQPLK